MKCPKWIYPMRKTASLPPPPWIGEFDASPSSVKIIISKIVSKQSVCVNICRQYYFFSNYISLSGLPSLFLRLTQNYEQTPRSSLRLVLLEIVVCFIFYSVLFVSIKFHGFPCLYSILSFQSLYKSSKFMYKHWCMSFSGWIVDEITY